MICEFIPADDAKLRCLHCGKTCPISSAGMRVLQPCGDTPLDVFRKEVSELRGSRPHPSQQARQAMPSGGPGAELTALFASLGTVPTKACPCKALAEQMDRLGVDGCRKHRDKIIAKLHENREAFGLADTAKAAALAIATGLAFKISWSDPLPDLFDLAVQRAEIKALASEDSGSASRT